MGLFPEPAFLGAVFPFVVLGVLVFLAPFFFSGRVFWPAALNSSSLPAAEVEAAAGMASPLGGSVGVSVGEEGVAALAAATLVVGSAALEAGQFFLTCPTSFQARHRTPSADQKTRCVTPDLTSPSRWRWERRSSAGI